MVPAAFSLKASSVLDRHLFNPELEETWRTHFDELSDEELRRLNSDDLCAGLLDRAARLKRVYERGGITPEILRSDLLTRFVYRQPSRSVPFGAALRM
jgi:hypothetical protein